MTSARMGNLEGVRALLLSGASLHLKCADGLTAFDKAKVHGPFEGIMKMLNEHRIRVMLSTGSGKERTAANIGLDVDH